MKLRYLVRRNDHAAKTDANDYWEEITVTPEQDSSNGVPRKDDLVEALGETWRVYEITWRIPYEAVICMTLLDAARRSSPKKTNPCLSG